jgi:RHS repeat-associated protein
MRQLRTFLRLVVFIGFIFWPTFLSLHAQEVANTAATADSQSDAAQTDTAGASATTATSDAGGDQTAAATTGDVPTDSAPTGVGAASPGGGLMNFQTDLFTGRFSYRVPIAVAPGRCNSQPNIALGYNSSGPNGWCGVGWLLDMGSIQRDTRFGVPRAWSGSHPANQYDDNKGFVFGVAGSLSPLVYTSGTDPKEYRLQAETGAFLTFLYYHPNSTSPYWLVTDKNGNKLYFGQTLATRMQNTKFPSNYGTSTFRWALDRAEDLNGNFTTLTYTTHSNQLYLSQISYNQHSGLTSSNTINFLLSDTRPDRTINLSAGYRVETRLLLTGIVVRASGQNVRCYSLAYTNSVSTKRCLLASVTQYDSGFTNALPALKFTYQTNSFRFNDLIDWPGLYSQGQSGDVNWNSVRAVDGSKDSQVEFIDIDRDGLPDRVMRKVSSPYDCFVCERNTGTNFFYLAPNEHTWSPLSSQGQSGNEWNSVRAQDGNNSTLVEFTDINGDGYPDRVMRQTSGYTNFFVQLNTGTGFTSPEQAWGPVTSEATGSLGEWRAVRDSSGGDVMVDFIDMNGDGLPDRVMRKKDSPYTSFKVQLNTGSGFTGLLDWPGVDSQGDTTQTWNSLYSSDGSGNTRAGLYDINGDGLPDRVMRQVGNGPYTKFVVQLNNGAGFEPDEDWGGTIDGQGQSGNGWFSPVGTDGTEVFNTLMDINGDGLMDRVMRNATGPYTNFVVQLNTGNGFTNSVNWSNVQADYPDQNWRTVTMVNSHADTKVDLVDINGDGLPDRVLRQANGPYTEFRVQLNAGPFPDLMSVIDNSMGGRVQISYKSSTTYNNRNQAASTDPWATGTLGQLGQAMWTVSRVIISDGVDPAATMTNTYSYDFGRFDYPTKEFRGFGKVTAKNTVGATTVTYFHQGGGWDNSANGEYNDANSFAKKGMAYRIEEYGAQPNTNLFRLTVNKVDETRINPSYPWYFARTTQTAHYTYEGLVGVSPKITLKILDYDTSNGNLIRESNLGEILAYYPNTHRYTDTGSDDVYNQYDYITVAGATRPNWIKTTSDSGGSVVLRQTNFEYDSNTANLLKTMRSGIATNTFAYDSYGNPTNATDPVGITTTTSYDATKTFTTANIVRTFTNQTVFDIRSGVLVSTINPAGLVASNVYDSFFRLTQSFISTNANGPAVLWRVRASYNLGNATNGTLYTHMQAYDPNDTVNGIESRIYMDGLGRAIQTRVEAEGTGKVRVSDTMYNNRGLAFFQTLPYFETSGWGFGPNGENQLGSYTGFDPVGRPVTAVSPAMFDGTPAGDPCSPVGASSIAYSTNNTLWLTVTTDAEGKVRQAINDAYGRITQVRELANDGTYTTTYNYDKVGNLTWLKDHLNNTSTMTYDDLGRKTSMIDPDMGTWTYTPDAAGRLTQQIDAKNQKLKFYYNDELGRLTKKEIYNSAGALMTNVTYQYDTSLKGQLYRVSDRQGTQTFGYDIRGRVLTSTRYLTVNNGTYTVQSKYDDSDRVTQIIYPNNAAKIQYAYDNANNLTNVMSLCGTPSSNEVFYSSPVFDELRRVVRFQYGNGVQTVVSNYPNSKRLCRIRASNSGTDVQNLTYCYDKVANVASITDSHFTGTACATITGVTYDNLHRLTGYVRPFGNPSTFTYNAIGNMTASSEGPSGAYNYGSSKPHAVTSVGSVKTYAYDACGNMTNRNGWALSYDEENQLAQVIGTNTVTFGYADGGARLWKLSGGQRTIWIGGIYEVRGSMVLCHVYAGGQRICTFEPSGTVCAWLYQHPLLGKSYDTLVACLDWPFKEGRTPLTATLIPLLGVLCASVGSRWHRRLACGRWFGCGGTGVPACDSGASILACDRLDFGSSIERRQARRWADYLGRDPIAASPVRRFCVSLINVLLIVAFFLAVTPTNVQAVQCSPVFWYYHNDNLGSSNVLTDRQGNPVKHYEYYAFGKDRYTDATCPLFNVSSLYTGQILDDDTGLYYYNARYYDPELGRFIQADSIVPSPGDPQTLNRYSYVRNNPLKYTDPTGHGNFWNGLMDSLGAAYSSPQAWSAIGIGGLGGPIGAACAALAIGTIAADNYVFGQVFGQRAGATHAAVGQIIMGVATIVAGVILVATGIGAPAGGYLIAAGVLTIAAGGLMIASTAASLAGEPSLASDLGWAAFGTGIAATVAGLAADVMDDHLQQVDPEPGEGNQPPTGRTTPLGVGTTREAAQAYANATGDRVVFVPSRGVVLDSMRASLEWLTGKGQAVSDMADYVARNPGMIYSKAHSEGSILMELAAKRLAGQNVGGAVTLYSAFYSQAAATRAFGGIGMQVNYVPQHFADPALVFATHNPAVAVGSAVTSIFTGFYYHGLATYP